MELRRCVAPLVSSSRYLLPQSPATLPFLVLLSLARVCILMFAACNLQPGWHLFPFLIPDLQKIYSTPGWHSSGLERIERFGCQLEKCRLPVIDKLHGRAALQIFDSSRVQSHSSRSNEEKPLGSLDSRERDARQ